MDQSVRTGRRGGLSPPPDSVRKGGTRIESALGLAEGATSFEYSAKHPEKGSLFASSMAAATQLVIEDAVGTLGLEGISVAVRGRQDRGAQPSAGPVGDVRHRRDPPRHG
ncbi:putative NBD/HSP70 family sugar kinase [Streptomyces aurantiacus]|nr:putative NBD/HSP70 family sugar kinase [Streptomyces aurantiacus]